MIPLQAKRASPEQRRLLDLFDRLDGQDRATLFAFAEFLAMRNDSSDGAAAEPQRPLEPEPIPRPDSESVVGAIKRLTRIYHMLPREALLNETSALMTAHVIQGRKAADVVDELESLFQAHYDSYRQQWDD